MRTPAQIEASRRNGAKSKGPKTEDGKIRSSQNAIKHGLTANKFVVLDGESGDDWETFHQSYIAKFQPRDPVEHHLVLEMAVNRWRLQRAWSFETAAIDEASLLQREIVEDRVLRSGMKRWCNPARTLPVEPAFSPSASLRAALPGTSIAR